MPELPEVHTTVIGLKRILPKQKIRDVWSAYHLPTHKHKSHIKSPRYYESFRDTVVGATVKDVRRRGKNILIDLTNGHTILIHMKMTGHFLYGKYRMVGTEWEPVEKTGALRDPFNKFIRFVFILQNGKHLAFSDLRKFGKLAFSETFDIENHPDLKTLGPEPLEKSFTYLRFKERLAKRPNGKIKQVLMDQTIIAGIGNIYSDEILWASGVHPLSRTGAIPEKQVKALYAATKRILAYSISLGGDSASDYRNLEGERGGYQNKHKAYHQTKKPCTKRGCTGIIERLKLGGRSAHFCNRHQLRFT